jgi:hypothetical protein
MSQITLDLATFRAQFPALAAASDAQIQMYWDMATCYISDSDYGRLAGKCRELAINLMAAHLLYLANAVAIGKIGGIINGSTIDKISVTLQQMPALNQWRWWLGHSPYGQQLLALLQSKAVGGFHVGGLPESAGFRKFGGQF